MAGGLFLLVYIISFVTRGQAYLQFVEPGYTTATSSSTYANYIASRTVDGDVSQQISRCLHTDSKTDINKAWLRVDLMKTISIKSVKFWYRNDRGSGYGNTIRLRGYSIRVSNGTALPPPESSCYTDPGNVTLSTIIEKDCERTAKYVWIYQDNTLDGICPILEICEVQVFGCETGKYGVNCNKTCSHCKNKVSCGAVSGKCNQEGCVHAGFQTPYCQHCIDGTYGEECSETCSEFCKSRNCDRKTGACNDGCLAGYSGNQCDQKCGIGRYGLKCGESCMHCLEGICNNVNGICTKGCESGFKAIMCNTPCDKGEYGRDCKHKCSGNCLNGEICDPRDGTCPSCAAGFQGTKCDQKCSDGTYGGNCSEICGGCLNGTTCHHVNGQCPSGCKPGWISTPNCDLPCAAGTFGLDCLNTCSGHCLHSAPCDRSTGHCQDCSQGWTNNFCNEQTGKPRKDLERMTLEHLKLDNKRLAAETAFLKTKEKYLWLKINSEFPIVLKNKIKPSVSERKLSRMKQFNPE
uniref:Multiple epidermal growth factor-like domains protein 10 isoform X2 n=1 Tax=Crassostrea virginica TaxID=6565 RepID=A0A8B8C9S5_CRAVI|nr:multiple epidermal growth factor-like domains protein 10 isoform X2 [Crassostrea virginica]